MHLSDMGIDGHGRRVAHLARHLARELRLTTRETELIAAAALVHDIGKVGLPREILSKPGCLNPDEKRIMDTHPQRGADWLRRYCRFGRAADYVLHHHERWDGAGYPGRLKGWEIPRGARLIAVADSLDALLSDRPYRPGLPLAQAARVLRRGLGRQWDPAVVDAALRLMDQGRLTLPAAIPSARPLARPYQTAWAQTALALWAYWYQPQPALALA